MAKCKLASQNIFNSKFSWQKLEKIKIPIFCPLKNKI